MQRASKPPGPPAAQDRAFVLSDFDVSQTIAVGAVGRVFLAKHVQEGRFVALKVLKKNNIVALKQVDHVKSEIKLLKGSVNSS